VSDQDQKQDQTEEQTQDNGEEQVVAESPEATEAPEAAAATPEAEDAEPTLDEMVGQLQDDLMAAQDSVLRAQADAQNTKRRAEQDIEKARKFALERFAGDLLPVIDNLERALESAAGDNDAIKSIAEGVELTRKGLLDAMKKYNIETVDPAGEPFDPQLHQAMSMVENPDVEPNTVIAVMQKGYTLNGRLIRPAMVMVSKAAEAAQ